MQQNTFVKSHGLGNDYIVIDSENINFELTDDLIKTICDEHFGIGSDGILFKIPSEIADFGVRIFNPDASEAENCGNGMRIFSKYLYDYKFTNKKSFTLDVLGRLIHCEILELRNDRVSRVRVEMGKASFLSSEVPLLFDKDECVSEEIVVADKTFKVSCVSMGNPHCVVLRDELDVDELMAYAPQIQALDMFPNGTNVQFVKVISRSELEIRIYERGAGYTLASGSSSCGVSACMFRNGLVDNNVTVKMPGGQLELSISDDWSITMTGPVVQVCEGVFSDELLVVSDQ